MRILLLIYTFLILLSFNSHSQKVKYKNLFPILQSKDYKTAEPLLIQFIEKNDKEANAYFYWGEILALKLDTVQIFPSTEKFDSLADAAIEAYRKSILLVDSKEIRKNDDFYVAYNRRDLRTGKFGIKISDIHLDYENKINSVVKKKESLHELHELKSKASTEYNVLITKANSLLDYYPNEASFLLRNRQENHEEMIKEIKTSYSDFFETYSQFVEKLKALNNPLYQPEIILKEVYTWNDLKPKKIDFENFSITVKDYKSYLEGLNQRRKSEIIPLKELLYKTDEVFNESLVANTKVTDSSGLIEMTIPVELVTGLKKLDGRNDILNLLSYKVLKNQSNVLSNVNIYPILADSSNVFQRANLISDLKNKSVEQLKTLEDVQIDEDLILDYKLFMEGFAPSIEAYINTEMTVLRQKVEKLEAENEKMAKQIQYFTHKKDTIFRTPEIARESMSENYVSDLLESDSTLILIGIINKHVFMASAGSNMKINHIKTIADTSYSIQKPLLLEEHLMVDTKSKQDSLKHKLYYLTLDMKEQWVYEFESDKNLATAKIEAGIFFLYDEEGNVLTTLNTKGEKIGN